MKKMLSAALMVVAATSISANAADMSMPYKAAPVMQSVYNWTGFYLGGTAGGGIANSDQVDIDQFFDGNDGGKFQQPFGTVGLTAGYNYQLGHTVLGIEGDYNWANVDNTKSSARAFQDDGDSVSSRFRMNEFATLRARGGLALDRTLFYATAGVAFAHIQNSTQFTENGAFFASASENKWKAGLAVGAGIEFALTQNWTLKGEYMLMQFQNSTADISNVGLQDCTPLSCRMSYSESMQVARVGVNYRFGN